MIGNEEIARRIKGYLQRARRNNLQVYKPNDKNLYRVMSGSRGDYGGREEIVIFRGKYLDVLAEAVQMPGFVGDWCSWSLADNCNHGYVERVEVKEPKIPKKAPNDLALRLKLGGVKW